MNKSVYALIILVLLIGSNAFALTIADVATTTQQTQQQVAQSNAEINAKITNLQNKLDVLMTRDEMQGLLEAHLRVTNTIVDNFRSQLMVGFIIIGLCLVGVTLGSLFYFKGAGRL